jgi:hypothetical protein
MHAHSIRTLFAFAAAPSNRSKGCAVYLSVVRAVIELAAGRSDHAAVVHYPPRVIELDPYDESHLGSSPPARPSERMARHIAPTRRTSPE